jgi:hypothetical protein
MRHLITHIDLTALTLANLPDSSLGKEYSVEIKRGSKARNSGVTKKVSIHFKIVALIC